MTPPGLPLPPHTAEFVAPPHWRAIEFASDLHLGDHTPRTIEAFAAYLRGTDADAVFLLGDLFEVWVGDDARHEGVEATLAALLAEATSRRTLAFMAGNRDFLVGNALLAACHMQALADPTVLVAFGQRVLLTHGDALCLGDTSYQAFRKTVRSTGWQDDFLSQPLAERRRVARNIRAESRRLKRAQPQSDWVDIDPDAAAHWLREANAATLIHGHTHVPSTGPVAPGLVRHVLSDWDFDGDASRGDVLRLDAGGIQRRRLPAC